MFLIPVIVVTALWFGDSTFAKKGQTNATASLTSVTNAADSLTVELDYATYVGQSASPNVNQWLGLRYAAPPLQDNRFRAPKPLVKEVSTIQAQSVSHLGL